MSRYGIGEWFGEPFATMSTSRRLELAQSALGRSESPECPFKSGGENCTKAGGVCSLQAYEAEDSRISTLVGPPVVVCPYRFDQDNLIPKWLAEIAGFDEVYIAREVPFMRAAITGREAGRIDLVLANNSEASDWYGLEVQAVYFSGAGMVPEFERIANDTQKKPPAPVGIRRPDWRSSSAKRLMPQLEVKVPTLRRWGKKLAVAVDLPFFNAIGGVSERPSHDLNEGDIIWLVPQLDRHQRLVRHHWEVLSLEDSSLKLLAAEPVRREDFENDLRRKLERL